LIGNAIKFTPKGGITVIADAELQHLNTKQKIRRITLCFEVRDTGSGIAATELQRIFNPFVQTGTGKSHEGTGLGLSISRKFAQVMGGDISVESDVGKGSVFKCHIQVHESEGADHFITQPDRPILGLAPNQPDYRILIVDDIKTNRQLLKSILELLGFDIREAGNGKEAITIWRKWQPHLIWMDIRMPVMDGYEATKRIRKEERKNTKYQTQTVIIALTAGVFEKQRAEALKIGCDGFVRKPLNEHEIYEKMHKHLGIRYVYEEESQAAGGRDQGARKSILVPEALAALPAPYLATLKQGARRADFLLLTNVIEQIRKHEPVIADVLEPLVEDFQYDKILTLIQQTGKGI